jgi:hypothetical protein
LSGMRIPEAIDQADGVMVVRLPGAAVLPHLCTCYVYSDANVNSWVTLVCSAFVDFLGDDCRSIDDMICKYRCLARTVGKRDRDNVVLDVSGGNGP